MTMTFVSPKVDRHAGIYFVDYVVAEESGRLMQRHEAFPCEEEAVECQVALQAFVGRELPREEEE